MSLPGYDLWLRSKEEAARQAGMAASSASGAASDTAARPGSLAGDLAARENDAVARQAADMAEAAQQKIVKTVLLAGAVVGAVAVLMYLSRD